MSPLPTHVLRIAFTRIAAAALALLTLLAAFSVPPLLAGDGPDSLVGKQAPELAATGWIDGDGRTTLADHLGDVVVIEFWSTHCAASRSAVRHLVDLTEDYGAKGLTVVGVTDETEDVVLSWLTHEDASVNYKIALGGGADYGVRGLPYAYLVGADGKVAWQGPTGSLSKSRIEELLKDVPEATPESRAAAAERCVAYARKLAGDGLVYRAHHVLVDVLESRVPAAREAAVTLMKSLSEGDNAAEFDAQRDLAKLLGGVERPRERIKSKKAESLAKKLEQLAEKHAEDAPRAASLAKRWAELLRTPWK